MQQIPDIPETLGSTVGGMFHDAVSSYPDTVALRSNSTSITYRDLGAQVNQLSNALMAQGVSRGDRVAILAENSVAFVTLLLACARIGAIATCLNWRSTVEDTAHCLTLTEPRMLFLSAQFAPLVPPDLQNVRIVDIDQGMRDLTAQHDASEPQVHVASEDGLLILFTSGSTGKPKAALVSHRAMIARGLVFRADLGIGRNDGYIAWSPLSHMAAADPTFACLIQGATVTVLPGFDPDAIVEALTQHPVGWLALLPGTIERMAEALERKRAPLQRVVATGAMADLIPGEQIARISRLLNAVFLNSFGSTETGLPPATASWFAPGEVPTPQTLGKRQNTACEIRLVDDNGNDVAPGEVGELWLRAPTLFSGYWGDAKATASAFADGWYHMGDAFRRDAHGLLHFADRKKYLIKSGGENIYPAEIERILRSIDGVLDASVVRRQDATWGEVPVAFVVVAPEHAPSKTTVQKILQARLARFKLPKAIVFVQESEIERNVTGKIRRDLLEQRAQESP